jgi:hypothetical protein
MVFALVFVAFVIAAPVMVSLATTFNKRIVRDMNDDVANRPSQKILDVVAAMSPAERVALLPTASAVPARVAHEKSDVRPSRQPAKEPISA